MTATPPDILLLSVTDFRAGRWSEIARLNASVSAFVAAHPEVRLRHLLLIQNFDGASLPIDATPAYLTLSHVERLLPSSAARNRLLNEADAGELIGPETIVAFPDDDAWYPDGTLDHIYSAFSDSPELDFWFTSYGMECGCPDPVPEKAPSFQEVISNSSCNTIVVRGKVLKQIGLFDEQLGLGVPANGGEDTDLGMRAYLRSREARMAQGRLIGHRDMQPALKRKYYAGGLMAIARNASGVAGKTALVRKLAVGVHMLTRGNLDVREYFGALRMATAFRRTTPPGFKTSAIGSDACEA